jgi:uncharacterized membrane protein YfcA
VEPLAFGYLAAAVMGATLGLLGGGGSILTVPILVYIVGVSPVRAAAYSLFVVGATALAGAARYLRDGLVDPRATVFFGLPSLAAVYAVRRFLVPALPDVLWQGEAFTLSKDLLVMVVFAAVMAATSLAMIRTGKERPEAAADRRRWAVAVAVADGVVVGGVTGFVGAGGGFLIVPALVIFLGLPMRTAIGTSLVIIAIKSLAGFLGDLAGPEPIDWALVLSFSGFAVAGILLGARIGRRVPAARLRPAFGWFVFVMSLAILAGEILKET